mgnify:CR=1 FL=1
MDEQPSLNRAYLSVHLEFSYEVTTVGKKTSRASFFTQESLKSETGGGRYDWLKLGIIPVGPKLSSLHQNKHNIFHIYNFEARLVPLESLHPGLLIGQKIDLKKEFI